MLALIAGTGALPRELVARLSHPPLVCAMQGSEPDQVPAQLTFRIENLGSFLAELQARGVTDVCLAGAVRRPALDPSALDAATLPLIPILQKALTSGDDNALRAIMGLLEGQGFAVRAAHDIAPDLLMTAGVPTSRQPTDADRADVIRAEEIVAAMAAADTGQACAVRGGQVLAMETVFGTDWMLGTLEQRPDGSSGGVLYKAPKAGQDLRADLPTIGPETVEMTARAGLNGIVVQAGQVIVLDQEAVITACDRFDMFLWLRKG
ncbi:UDP-2,3-diacylglucosamine diphosphatase LpxI [Aliisedimentitalea scapharcae]|uniref:UDP-2,3-diacylglucosamine diphosphatase LpxI n=1 Tax=Aliisedimentitalea scapharcae TaxID=1524259 RepID=A0ABZ2XMB3_9RHOB